MSYIPTEWHSGDTITSAKLNKLENGVANNGALGVQIAQAPNNNITLQMEAGELFEACNKQLVYIYQETTTEPSNIPGTVSVSETERNCVLISEWSKTNDNYQFSVCFNSGDWLHFIANSADVYPQAVIPSPSPDEQTAIVLEEANNELPINAGELWEAYLSGKPVRVIKNDSDIVRVYNLMSADHRTYNDSYTFDFGYRIFDASSGYEHPTYSQPV